MCGRFTLSANKQRLKDTFPLWEFPDVTAHYNVAPTQAVRPSWPSAKKKMLSRRL
jgi:putative SOS response-associated peptidase YedK